MRMLVFAVALCVSMPARADSCEELAVQVSSATGIEIGEREPDFVSYPVDADTLLTLACNTNAPSSVGVRHRGGTPPDSYFRLIGQVGQVVTGIAAARIAVAAQRAWVDAPTRKHSNVPADGVLVTCALTRSGKGDALTLCAVVAQSDAI